MVGLNISLRFIFKPSYSPHFANTNVVGNFILMKSTAELKFDRIVKQGFHETLKPMGFKKKGNNFYQFKNGIGHIINLQKSSYYSKDKIHFTINAGIFLPEFWTAFYNYKNKPIPDYPTEPECILRRRIGQLKNENDLWFDITEDTDEKELIDEMKNNLNQHILPYFGQVLSKDMLIDKLDNETTWLAPLEKLIVFGELGDKEKTEKEFRRLVSETRNPNFLGTVKDYGKKYGLI
jgi:hypothetical protein